MYLWLARCSADIIGICTWESVGEKGNAKGEEGWVCEPQSWGKKDMRSRAKNKGMQIDRDIREEQKNTQNKVFCRIQTWMRQNTFTTLNTWKVFILWPILPRLRKSIKKYIQRSVGLTAARWQWESEPDWLRRFRREHLWQMWWQQTRPGYRRASWELKERSWTKLFWVHPSCLGLSTSF